MLSRQDAIMLAEKFPQIYSLNATRYDTGLGAKTYSMLVSAGHDLMVALRGLPPLERREVFALLQTHPLVTLVGATGNRGPQLYIQEYLGGGNSTDAIVLVRNAINAKLHSNSHHYCPNCGCEGYSLRVGCGCTLTTPEESGWVFPFS